MDAKDKVVQLIETAKSCGLKMKLRSMKALEAPEEPVVLSPERYRKYKITALIVVIVGAVLLIAFVFGLVSYTTMREQEELHQQQLELLRDKTTSLEEKMDKMDSLDQELRQMVKGAGAGESPKGEGSVVGQKKKSEDLSHAVARTGVPYSTPISMPSWKELAPAIGLVRYPYWDVIVPFTGQIEGYVDALYLLVDCCI